jgi:hypothetical protein
MPPKKKQKTKKKITRKNKFWLKLKGTYEIDGIEENHLILKNDVERLIASVQQELEWDDRDMQIANWIDRGILNWSGEIQK